MKTPRLGTVKTRMQPQLTPEQSLQLYRAMGRDLVAQHLQQGAYRMFISYWPADGLEEMKAWLGKDGEYLLQTQGDLGKKMGDTFQERLSSGSEKVCIIGSDLPTIDTHLIERAFELLDSSDVVLGPTDDGGYYLIAMKAPNRIIFKDVAWSSEAVFDKTLENAAEGGLRIELLEQLSDIDSYTEVKDLWLAINNDQKQLRTQIPLTSAVLADIWSDQ